MVLSADDSFLTGANPFIFVSLSITTSNAASTGSELPLVSHCVWVPGTFWGELGFFKLERGVNSLQIESGDCWYAEPEYKIEEEVREGELGGSMYGLVHRNHSTPKASVA